MFRLSLSLLLCVIFLLASASARPGKVEREMRAETKKLKARIKELEAQLEKSRLITDSGDAEPTHNGTSSCACPNVFATADPVDLAKLGQTFFMPLLSELSHIDEEVKKYTGLDKVPELDSYWTSGLAVQMLSVPTDTADFDSVAHRRLQQHGLVAIPSVIPAEQCAPAAARAVELIKGDASQSFSSIMESFLRKDMPLDFSHKALVDILYQAVDVAAGPLKRLLGDNATLVEFSTLTSFPGATMQSMHPDAGMAKPEDNDNWAKVVSCYLYLVDVTTDMAALDVWPGTHTHVHFLPDDMPWNEDARHENAVRSPAIRMAVPAGTMVLFDSRTYHRGSANTSPRGRPTVYFSMMSATGEIPDGPTFTLLPKYKGKITLEQLLQKDVHLKEFEEDAEAAQREQEFASKLAHCQEFMVANCGEHLGDPQKCYECANNVHYTDEDEEEEDVEGCDSAHFIERVCKVGVFAETKKEAM